jgi:amidase
VLPDEYMRYDATGLAALLRRREVTAAELVEASRALAQRANPAINAIVEMFGQAGSGRADGAFGGVPFLVKDIGCTAAGRRCEAGSRLLEGWVAADDAPLMRAFRAAGLSEVGRAATSELAGVATVETILHGATRNPWNPSLSTGGSSGGSAAAVAARIVPIAHGSDGGGSIRIPAACCGVVGLKPTRGRVLSPSESALGDLSVDFALTRTVRDAAALLDAVCAAGELPGQSGAFGSVVSSAEARPRLKIAVTSRHFWGRATDPEIGRATWRIADACAELGHDVTEAHPAFDADSFRSAMCDVWAVMTAVTVDWACREVGRAAGPDTLEGATLSWYGHGRALSATAVAAALETLRSIARRVLPFFDEHDVLLTPTIPALPPPLGEYDPRRAVDPAWYYEQSSYGNLESFTSLFNCTGQPAVSLPLQQSDGGLPIGIQLAAGLGREDRLLALAAELEAMHPWAGRQPPATAAAGPDAAA